MIVNGNSDITWGLEVLCKYAGKHDSKRNIWYIWSTGGKFVLKIRLNDVTFWFGSFKIYDLENDEEIFLIKLSGGFFGRLTHNIFNPNGESIAKMKNPNIATLAYRQRITDVKGDIVGEIEPKITMGKLLENAKQTINPYKDGGGKKFLKGAHFADITFRGAKYLAEAYWPGYRQIKVTKDNSVVMTLERKFIVSEWFDFLILNHLAIEKSQYDVIVYDTAYSREDYALLALMIRQFFRHNYGKKRG